MLPLLLTVAMAATAPTTAPADAAPPAVTTTADDVVLVDIAAIAVMAGLAPIVTGAAGAGLGLAFIAAVGEQLRLGWSAYLVLAAFTAVGAVVGVPLGPELGVAVFGNARDHGWVTLGATTGTAIGLLVASSAYRAGSPFAAPVAAAAVLGGPAAGVGAVLVARHAQGLPELHWSVSGGLIGVGASALIVGAGFTLLGSASNDSLAGPDDAIAPTVMVAGAATLAAGYIFAPRHGVAEAARLLIDPTGAMAPGEAE